MVQWYQRGLFHLQKEIFEISRKEELIGEPFQLLVQKGN